jgi:Flp pilus assembly pilin Flp
MTDPLRQFLKDRSGATTIEYALIVCAVSLAIMIALWAAAGGIRGTFDVLSNFFSTAGK